MLTLCTLDLGVAVLLLSLTPQSHAGCFGDNSITANSPSPVIENKVSESARTMPSQESQEPTSAPSPSPSTSAPGSSNPQAVADQKRVKVNIKLVWRNHVPNIYMLCYQMALPVDGGKENIETYVSLFVQRSRSIVAVSAFATTSCKSEIATQLSQSITLVEYDKEFNIQTMMVRYNEKGRCRMFRIRGNLVYGEDCLNQEDCKTPPVDKKWKNYWKKESEKYINKKTVKVGGKSATIRNTIQGILRERNINCSRGGQGPGPIENCIGACLEALCCVSCCRKFEEKTDNITTFN